MSTAKGSSVRSALVAAGVLLAIGIPGALSGQDGDSLEVRLRLDRGSDPVVVEGDEVRIYYELSATAYVAIFRIDTEGRASLLFPQYPNASTRVRGGREHRLILAESRRWEVEDRPGDGYFVAIASEEPLDFSLFDFDVLSGWVLTTVGENRYDDPYEAIDDYVVAVLPTWEEDPFALDLLPYRVLTADEVAEGVPALEAPDEDEAAAQELPDREADEGREPGAATGEPGRAPAEDGAYEDHEGTRPSERAPRIVIVVPGPAPRYLPPPVYRPRVRYGPPSPRYRRPRVYGPRIRYGPPPPRYHAPAPRLRHAPPVRGRAPHAPPRRRYKERPVRQG